MFDGMTQAGRWFCLLYMLGSCGHASPTVSPDAGPLAQAGAKADVLPNGARQSGDETTPLQAKQDDAIEDESTDVEETGGAYLQFNPGEDGIDPNFPADITPPSPIYSPEPRQDKLLSTRAAQAGLPGATSVYFCISRDGKAIDVQTREKFPGDPGIDALLRETVAGWRFRPALRHGMAITVCTHRTFNIQFR